jgi:hypothetical protein
MKYLIIIFPIISLIGCTNDDNFDTSLRLKDGYYDGYFKDDTLQLWESFGIKIDSFVEFASGGVWCQKYPQICLTKGTYKIINDSIYFENIQTAQPPNYSLTNCDRDCLLMGNYYIESFTDSTIVFWRNAHKGRQEYQLKLYFTGK